jgi:hypothetical protein
MTNQNAKIAQAQMSIKIQISKYRIWKVGVSRKESVIKGPS